MAEAAGLIRESVGAALRFSRENARFIAVVGGVGALVMALLALLGLVAQPVSLITSVASGVAQAFAYAALTGAALFGASEARRRWLREGGRLWAAMVIVGFFLFIVFFVISIPVMMVLAVGPLAAYRDELTSAGANQAEVMAVMTRFAEENPGVMIAVFAFYCAAWLLLSSRLYLAAPATVEQERVSTFETWAWTRGSTLRIVGARLMLLLPANIFVGALGYLAGRLVGVDTLNPTASVATVAANPLGFAFYVFVATFLSLALYSALEAGLSATLYRALKPAAAESAVRGSTDS
jgi:hypothetical protein